MRAFILNRSLAISRVRRTSDTVDVTLNSDGYRGESVTLEKRGNRFVIVDHGAWIV